MSHFAEVVDGTVTRVIVADQEFIYSGAVGDPARWIQTSYNTQAGVHKLGGTPLRKNYAGVGFAYDPVRDAFIPPQPYPSWVLDEASCQWNAPVPMPSDGGRYRWDEPAQAWVSESNG